MRNSGKLVVVLLVLLGLSSIVLGLTDEEMIRKLDERFIKGEIPVDVYRELKKKYTGEKGAPQVQAKPVQETPGNLVKNGSMEEDTDDNRIPDNWQEYRVTAVSQFVIDLDSQVKHSGDKSVRFQFDKDSNYGGIIQIIKAEPGKKYLISCWLKGENLKGRDAFILQASAHPTKAKAENVTEKGTQLVSKEFWKEAEGTFDWKRMVAKTKPAPGDAEYLRIYIRHFNPAAGSTEWVDDVVVVPVD